MADYVLRGEILRRGEQRQEWRVFAEAEVPVALGINNVGMDNATRAIGMSYLQSFQAALNGALAQIPRSAWAEPQSPTQNWDRVLAELDDLERRVAVLKNLLNGED